MQVSNVSGQTAGAVSPTAGRAQDTSRETFLRLLIAQLEHQNPLSPVEGAEFTAQLAQFSALEQLQAMNVNLDTLVTAQERLKGLQAADLIGKEVKAQGSTISLRQGNTSPLQYALTTDSPKVTISILDNVGNVVRSIEKLAQKAGVQSVSWDGKTAQGVALPDGEYRFVVLARDSAGNPVSVQTFLQGKVEGVEYAEGQPSLLVGGRRVALTSLISVKPEE
jgi:flagellar basal-body rod modification protein FlgD